MRCLWKKLAVLLPLLALVLLLVPKQAEAATMISDIKIEGIPYPYYDCESLEGYDFFDSSKVERNLFLTKDTRYHVQSVTLFECNPGKTPTSESYKDADERAIYSYNVTGGHLDPNKEYYWRIHLVAESGYDFWDTRSFPGKMAINLYDDSYYSVTAYPCVYNSTINYVGGGLWIYTKPSKPSMPIESVRFVSGVKDRILQVGQSSSVLKVDVKDPENYGLNEVYWMGGYGDKDYVDRNGNYKVLPNTSYALYAYLEPDPSKCYFGDKVKVYYNDSVVANSKVDYFATKAFGEISLDYVVSFPFKDVPLDPQNKSCWFYEAVRYCSLNGLMNGKNETTFAPYEYLARAQFAQILYNMEGKPAVSFKAKFSDVSAGHWYADAVTWASNAGIIVGYTSGVNKGKFGAGDNITREQMVIMMYRYAKYKGYNISYGTQSLSSFSDYKSVSSYAEEAMKWAVQRKIITGKDNGTKLDPLGNTSRAECAIIIKHFMDWSAQYR